MGEPLYRDERQKIQLEAINALQLFDEVQALFHSHSSAHIISRPEIELLHKVAIKDIYSCAGRCREWSVTIVGSRHKPPGHPYVEGLIDQMCDEANSREDWDELEVAAYVLWRMNWIHPFAGGNGRTSRAACYLVLCRRLGFMPPGKLTILEQIVSHRTRYQDGLEDADAAWRSDSLDVSKLIALLHDFLVEQLKG